MRQFVKQLAMLVPLFRNYIECRIAIGNRFSFWQYLFFLFKKDKSLYFPIHKVTEIGHPKNIFVGLNSNVSLRMGQQIQALGKLFIGDFTRIAPKVGIFTANHNTYNHHEHTYKETIIGDYCWIGSGALIMPGVVLGKHTIVGAGAVVTKSFPDGYQIIAGNPAHVVKVLEKEKFDDEEFKSRFKYLYYGFVPKEKFAKFREKHLRKLKFEYDISQVSDNEFYRNNKYCV
jgi:acetyltransferase-like isoleucine patch superfamily enzyme